jgi:hypothetical protein
MKTLVRRSVSIMVLSDDVPVNMGPVIEIYNPPKYLIDNRLGEIQLYENVTPPENYRGNLFCYDGENWTPNPNWRGDKLVKSKR